MMIYVFPLPLWERVGHLRNSVASRVRGDGLGKHKMAYDKFKTIKRGREISIQHFMRCLE